MVGRRCRPATADPAIPRCQGLAYPVQRRGLKLSFAIKELLALRVKAGGNSKEVRALAESKLEAVENKIEKLKQMRGELKHVLETCECGGKVRCPALEALDYSAVG